MKVLDKKLSILSQLLPAVDKGGRQTDRQDFQFFPSCCKKKKRVNVKVLDKKLSILSQLLLNNLMNITTDDAVFSFNSFPVAAIVVAEDSNNWYVLNAFNSFPVAACLPSIQTAERWMEAFNSFPVAAQWLTAAVPRSTCCTSFNSFPVAAKRTRHRPRSVCLHAPR